MVKADFDPNQIRVDFEAGLGYRELAKKYRLSFRDISKILKGDEINNLNTEIYSKKQELKKISKEVESYEKRRNMARKEYYEYLNYKPLFDALNEIKRIGGPKNYVLETWWDWMKRSGITEHDIKMFYKRKYIDHLRAEGRRLDIQIRELKAGRSRL